MDALIIRAQDHQGSALISPQEFEVAGIDLGFLTREEYVSLQISVSNFRSSQSRIASELCFAAAQMEVMQGLLKEKFFPFTENVLGYNKKKVQRMLKVGRVLKTHFSDGEGRYAPHQVTNWSQKALLLLTEDTADEIVDHLKEISESQEVTSVMVRKLLDERDSGDRETAESLAAELALEKKEKQQIKEKLELAESRERTARDTGAESLRRSSLLTSQLEVERDALEKKIKELQTAKVTVQDVEKEVPPKGYQSCADAIADINRLLN